MRLVRTGENIMQDLCDQNSTLERQLTVANVEAQISTSESQMLRALSGLTRRATLDSQGSDSSNYRDAVESFSGGKAPVDVVSEHAGMLAAERENTQMYKQEAEALLLEAEKLRQVR